MIITKQVLNEREIEYYLREIKKHFSSANKSKYSIIKQGGHTTFMNKIREHPKVRQEFAKIWNDNNLVTSYDSYGVMLKGDDPVPLWPHRDEPLSKRKRCYQGFVQLTSNENEGLVVWPNGLEDNYKLIKVKAGTLVIWDSKLIHCNLNNGERDRIVMYVCMVPKDMVSKKALRKLERYKEQKITTGHSPFFPQAHP